MELKSRLSYWIRKEGRSNKWLAENLKVSQETVSRWSNDRGVPSVKTLFRIASLLNCKVDDLYEIING